MVHPSRTSSSNTAAIIGTLLGLNRPALHAAIHLTKPATKPKPASITVDKSPRFSLAALLDARHETGSLMRQYATWRSYRLEEDADILHSASGTPFTADCKLAPGVISLEYAQALLSTLGKPTTSSQVKAFIRWAKKIKFKKFTQSQNQDPRATSILISGAPTMYKPCSHCLSALVSSWNQRTTFRQAVSFLYPFCYPLENWLNPVSLRFHPTA